MLKRITVAVGICALLVAASCGKKGKEAPEGEPPKEQQPAPGPPEPPPPEPESPKATVSAFVSHEVAEFDVWKREFDAHAEARKEAGVIWHSVSRDVREDDLVYVHLVAGDMAKLEAFVGSDELESAMGAAGVKGKPEVWLASDVRIDSPKEKISGETFSVIARHAVEDFDAWKPVFDADAATRADAMGAIGGSVSRAADDPNMVIMHFLVSDSDRAVEVLGSDDMKQKMAEAGVKGEPEVRIGKDVETSSY